MVEIAWVKLELTSGPSAPSPSCPRYLEGIRVLTLPELGDSERNRRAIYQLNRECAADIPERGEFFSWAEYQQVRFNVPRYRPDGQVLAVAGDELLGLCQVSQRPGAEWAFVEMTGVRRGWRARGIATALKLAAIHATRGWGATHLRTVHHPDNQSIIALNRRLGFQEANFNMGAE